MENWSPESRYEPQSEEGSRTLLAAISNPDHGVFTCIKTTLVRADIQGGERVVSALEASGLKVTAAFWADSRDEHDWKLVVVSPDVAEKGGTQAYKLLFELLPNLDVEPPEPFDSWWRQVKIISPATLIYRRLKERAGNGDKPVRPGWASDAYIYKME